MTKLELAKVMEATDIPVVRDDEYGKKYQMNNLVLSHEGDFDVYLDGEVPLEFLEYFKVQYPEYNGSSNYWCRVNNEDNDNKLLFRRKEVLLMFLLEYKDYLLRKEGKEETEVKKYEGLLNSINRELFVGQCLLLSHDGISYAARSKSRSYKHSTVYVIGNELYVVDEYLPLIRRHPNTMQEDLLIRGVLGFDRAVNPFMRSDFTEEEIVDGFNKRVVVTSKKPSKYIEMQIDNRNGMNDGSSENYVQTRVDNNGFEFTLKTPYVRVSHKFDKEEEEEVVTMTEYNNGVPETIRYVISENYMEHIIGDQARSVEVTPDMVYQFLFTLHSKTQEAAKISSGGIVKFVRAKRPNNLGIINNGGKKNE